MEIQFDLMDESPPASPRFLPPPLLGRHRFFLSPETGLFLSCLFLQSGELIAERLFSAIFFVLSGESGPHQVPVEHFAGAFNKGDNPAVAVHIHRLHLNHFMLNQLLCKSLC